MAEAKTGAGNRAYKSDMAWLVLVVACFAALAWSGASLTREEGQIAALWLPNAFLVAVILPLRWSRAWPYLIPCFAANVLVNLSMGDPYLLSAGLAVANFVEIVVVYYGLRRMVGSRPDITDFNTLGWFALIGGVIAPAVSGVVAALTLAVSLGASPHSVWFSWTVTDGLGMLIGAPVLMILLDAAREPVRISRTRLLEWVAILTVVTAGTAYVFIQTSYPFLFMASLFVLLAAFRLRMIGAAVSTIVVAVIAIIATSLDRGPIHLVRGDLYEKLMVLEVFLLFTFAMAVPVAAALATRDKLKQDLGRSRDMQRAILSNLRDVVFQADGHGRWTYLNPAWEDLTGYSIEESLGKPTTWLLLPEDLEETTKYYPQLLAGEIEELTLNQHFRRADGEVRQIEVKVRALRGPNGEFVGSNGNLHDVTEAREAQEALIKSEKLFQTLASVAPVGIVRTDADGACNYANETWLDLAGITMDAALGFGWAQALHPEDSPVIAEKWAEAVRTQSSFREEFRFLRPDGSIAPVISLAKPEVDESGQTLGYVAVILDMSEIIETRRDLENERSRYKYLADHSTDAIMTIGPDRICRYASPAMTELSGYEPAEVIGTRFKLPFEEDMAKVEKVYDTLFAGEANRAVVSYRIKHKTKGLRWHEARIRLVRNSVTGVPEETVANLRDVTDRVELEDELRDARDAAEAAATAKSSFLANMSHEIRTPMNGVLGFVDLLIDSDLDKQQREYAELIAESGHSMLALINDILDLSKIEAGQMSVSREPLDIRHTVDATLRLMRAAASQKDLQLETEFDERIAPAMLGDRLRIKQIISNLVGNAIKFTESGAITVRVGLTEGTGGQDTKLSIAVQDTGIGIDEARLAAIFDEFVQADGSTARKFGGTGLGLAISRRLANLMDGKLTVTSQSGEGSTFTLTLPYSTVSEIAQETQETVSERRDEATVEHDKRRILVAEDNEINQALIGAQIQKTGYTHDLAQDGLEAIEMIAEAEKRCDPYSLVLMDVQMPNMDGIEATRRIRASGVTADSLPIIAITANAFHSDIEDCLEAGMQGHVAKPVRMEDIASLFEAWLPKQRAIDTRGEVSALEKQRPKYEAFKTEALARLAECQDKWPDAPPELLDEVRGSMHKLAGTAALFGDGDLGEIARDIERLIDSMTDGDRTVDLGEALSKARDAA